MELSGILEDWYEIYKRNFPWRISPTPYHIWLSEIILQQTRTHQGVEYYTRFVEKYPTIHHLAGAPADEVMKMWQGLGYYTRARNLHATAAVISGKYRGMFPDSYDELLKLKGIGKYTAAAIASIAFKKPVPLVDGNVYRVISRVFGIFEPPDSKTGIERCYKIAGEILNSAQPDIHNQAMMEFGALVCTPKKPLCHNCVLAKYCYAVIHEKVSELPVKKKKAEKRVRHFNYFFIRHNDSALIRKRQEKDIWHSLFEFPMIETQSAVNYEYLKAYPFIKLLGKTMNQWPVPLVYRHQLTHQVVICYFYVLSVKTLSGLENGDYIRIPVNRLHHYAVPRVIDRFMGDLGAKGLL